jgi:hypothetical protein
MFDTTERVVQDVRLNPLKYDDNQLDYFEMNFVFEEPHPQTKPKVRP